MKDNMKSPEAARAFVKKEGDKLKGMMGEPNMKGLSDKFNAEMSNDGKHAQALGSKLMSGVDKAFPRK